MHQPTLVQGCHAGADVGSNAVGKGRGLPIRAHKPPPHRLALHAQRYGFAGSITLPIVCNALRRAGQSGGFASLECQAHNSRSATPRGTLAPACMASVRVALHRSNAMYTNSWSSSMAKHLLGEGKHRRSAMQRDQSVDVKDMRVCKIHGLPAWQAPGCGTKAVAGENGSSRSGRGSGEAPRPCPAALLPSLAAATCTPGAA